MKLWYSYCHIHRRTLLVLIKIPLNLDTFLKKFVNISSPINKREKNCVQHLPFVPAIGFLVLQTNYGNLVQMIPLYRSIYTQHSTESELKRFLGGYWYKESEKRANKVWLKHICIKQIPFLFDRHMDQQISGSAIISGKLALPAPCVFLWMQLDSTS